MHMCSQRGGVKQQCPLVFGYFVLLLRKIAHTNILCAPLPAFYRSMASSSPLIPSFFFLLDYQMYLRMYVQRGREELALACSLSGFNI